MNKTKLLDLYLSASEAAKKAYDDAQGKPLTEMGKTMAKATAFAAAKLDPLDSDVWGDYFSEQLERYTQLGRSLAPSALVTRQ